MSNYPDGKLNNEDKGELKITTFITQGRVVIDFNKKVTWVGFNKQELRELIDSLEKLINLIK